VAGPVVLALAAALCFAAAAVFLRRALQYASSRTAAVLTVTFTAGCVWAVTAATAPLALIFTPHVLPFVVAGVAAPGLARLAYYTGVDRVGVARATALVSTAPLLAVALAIVALDERPTATLIAGAVSVVAGGVLLSLRGRTDVAWRRRDLALPVIGAVGFAVRDVVSRHGLREFPEPMIAAAVATLTSVVLMWGLVAVTGTATPPARSGLTFIVLAGLSEGMAYLTMWRALATADVSVVSPLISAQPVFAVALTALFLRDLERVTWRIVLGAALIVTGVALVIRFR
jgi:drug/metabolite transporter, DME family